jgi:hypothetical protein
MPHCRLRCYVDSAPTRAKLPRRYCARNRSPRKNGPASNASPWVIRVPQRYPGEVLKSKPAGEYNDASVRLRMVVISSQPAPTGADTWDSGPGIPGSSTRCEGGRYSHSRDRDPAPGDARDWCIPSGSGRRPSPARGSSGSDHRGSSASVRPLSRAGPGSLAPR